MVDFFKIVKIHLSLVRIVLFSKYRIILSEHKGYIHFKMKDPSNIDTDILEAHIDILVDMRQKVSTAITAYRKENTSRKTLSKEGSLENHKLSYEDYPKKSWYSGKNRK